ncbi:hypothetical protein ATANTOWER_031699 [Ataeniobius toweri]|uniref:Uncharacterized protein n=1 Tax=Ataeniobius toweri TaxID=208326 RepID=A0ABU7CBF1_9TELE|nr:hypothetical protein [Ataeniobius toweri]
MEGTYAGVLQLATSVELVLGSGWVLRSSCTHLKIAPRLLLLLRDRTLPPRRNDNHQAALMQNKPPGWPSKHEVIMTGTDQFPSAAPFCIMNAEAFDVLAWVETPYCSHLTAM